jgi:RNA-splicing ligase RtcB
MMGHIMIRLHRVASNFGNRGTGHQVKNLISNTLHSSNGGNVSVSFENIHIVSSSFADEAFAKLASEMGENNFMAHVQLVNMNQIIKAIVRRVFQKRLGSSTLIDNHL